MSKQIKPELSELATEVDREIKRVESWITEQGISPTRRKGLFDYEADLYSIRQMLEMGIHQPGQIQERFEEAKEKHRKL